jgi:hypothetical protein
VDPTIRRQASQFLEVWTKTPKAWEVYAKWLASSRQQRVTNGFENNNQDQIAVHMLCLTMLQSKIRREIRRSQPPLAWNPSIAAVRVELWEYLRQLRPDSPEDRSLLTPCCICNAAMMCRSSDGMMAEFMSKMETFGNDGDYGNQTAMLARETTLRLLACIPGEMEACQEFTNAQVTAELAAHLEVVLATIQKGLVQQTTTLSPACQALKSWAETAHVSLSQLNAPTCGGSQGVLPTMIHLLSSTIDTAGIHNNISGSTSSNGVLADSLPYDELVLRLAAQALSTAIMVVSDQCSPSRTVAAEAMWSAINQQGFILHPLKIATQQEWYDACHALASLLSTFVTEQVDDLVSHPADVGLQVLLEIQTHPYTPVAMIPLECWLTIQDVPMDDRHEDWKQPLYRRLVDTLVARMAYPHSFVSWDEELEVDESEFYDFRRLVADVLVGCYFLLRVEMIHMLVRQVLTATHWTMSESALYALAQISKDVTARCKSPAADGTIVARDRLSTCHDLLQLLHQLMSVDIDNTLRQNPLLLGGVVNFCGNYSLAWNSMKCPPQVILQLLSYLQFTFKVLPIEAAKAMRAVCISCLAKDIPLIDEFSANPAEYHMTSSILPMILKSVKASMDAVLATTEEQAMTMVAEGLTRIVTKLKDVEVARQALTDDLISPVLHHIHVAIQHLPQGHASEVWTTAQTQEATEALVRYLAVLQVIVRFSESPHFPGMGEWFLPQIGSCLEAVQLRTFSTPAQSQVLTKWILVHQQILRIRLPQQDVTIAILSSTIPLVVQTIEQSKEPAALKYVATAVENFGGKTEDMDRSFQDLLSHLTNIISSHPNLPEATELLQGYFDCLQRFLLYCPRALCYSPKLAEIIILAVESISAMDDKGATRAALIFLSQLFGWNSLRLSPPTLQIMQDFWKSSSVLKEALLARGEGLVHACFIGLAGGSQMLWPAYSDCLFAIVQAFILSPLEDRVNSSANPATPILSELLLQRWLLSGMMATFSVDSDGSATNANINLCNRIISILLDLARQGPKCRPRAKMLLTDFAKIRRGEMTTESLASYTTPQVTYNNTD